MNLWYQRHRLMCNTNNSSTGLCCTVPMTHDVVGITTRAASDSVSTTGIEHWDAIDTIPFSCIVDTKPYSAL
ncbi:hypothetical protein GBA52_003708 [Prunus armeniaca]|nr:hypothetical protein GBA52_003708 [Prunus armeniaca]